MEGWCVEGWCGEGVWRDGVWRDGVWKDGVKMLGDIILKNSHSTWCGIINDYQMMASPNRGVPGYDWLLSRSV